jgi:hypothetical protein
MNCIVWLDRAPVPNSNRRMSAHISQYETLGGMSAVPMTYVIGRDGEVVDAQYGYEEDRAKKALKKLGL